MKERNNCNIMGKTSDYIYRMLMYWTLASVKPLAWASGGYLKKNKKTLKKHYYIWVMKRRQTGLWDEKGLGVQ